VAPERPRPPGAGVRPGLAAPARGRAERAPVRAERVPILLGARRAVQEVLRQHSRRRPAADLAPRHAARRVDDGRDLPAGAAAKGAMTALVTGATGFLGSALVERLLARGARAVRCFVRSERKAARLDDLGRAFPDARVERHVGTLASPAGAAAALD